MGSEMTVAETTRELSTSMDYDYRLLWKGLLQEPGRSQLPNERRSSGRV
jgi:hypothetical protein